MKSVVHPVAVVLTIALCPAMMKASGPIAVYGLVDKVTFEPGADKPERIRISGVFITATNNSGAYSTPQRGYLYFMLPRGNEELARREWADLNSVAGTRQVVGFGTSWAGAFRVRRADETAKSPDDYPLGNGLVKLNSDHPQARALLEHKEH
jgi:hypothetical protein